MSKESVVPALLTHYANKWGALTIIFQSFPGCKRSIGCLEFGIM